MSGKQTDFNFIFKYGIGMKNELNTFNQTYTKDMVEDSSITIKLELSGRELVAIEQKIDDLKLFIKDERPNKEGVMMLPCGSYYLKVQKDLKEKELFWDECVEGVNGDLSEFSSYINDILESKKEYKKLPTPRAGYI